MKKADCRELALKTLQDCEQKGLFVNDALAMNLAQVKLSEKDRALCTELVNGSLRWRKKLDWFISHFSNKPPEELSNTLLNILRLAFYQKLFLTRVPDYALVNEAVEMTKTHAPKASTFINAVLRQFLKKYIDVALPSEEENPVRFLALKYSFPEWLIKYWYSQLSQHEIRALCEAINQPAPLTIRVNTLLTSPEKLIRALAEENVVAAKCRYAPEGLIVKKSRTSLTKLKSFQAGLFTIQSESSMLISLLLSPAKNSLVLDFCAGGGGKSTHLAQIMENTGKIVAFERNSAEIKRLKTTVKRLKLKNVQGRVADLTSGQKEWRNKADYILVDAPCSGLGTLRRYADLRWRKSPSIIDRMVGQQAKIMATAAQCLKPGGRVVYAVCTNTFEENEMLITSFLNRHPQFELEVLADRFPSHLKKITAEKVYFKTLPHRDNLDGFFAVSLKKRGS